jgi:hypothetical protein
MIAIVVLGAKPHPSKMSVSSFSKPLMLLSTHWKSPIDKWRESALQALRPELREHVNLFSVRVLKKFLRRIKLPDRLLWVLFMVGRYGEIHCK